ncbi:MAG: peptidylprolyl isomerase [Ignavibacteriae bacterium]|nr:peptidylprolyl isomerase [Ignavibacteriota bacterium]
MLRKLLLKNILILIISVFSFWSCLSKNENPQLAEFENGNVLQSEYIEHFLLSTKFKPDQQPTIENLQEIVSNKALEKISVIEALSKNIDKDSTYLSIIENNQRRLYYQNYIQKQISEKMITDSVVNKFYSEFTPQYRMSYIMRPFLDSSSDEFHVSQLKEINSAYSELQKGKKFEEVAANFSQDISTNKKGGDLGWIIRESIGDEEIRKVMDTLKDFTYSKPFKGIGGYYILYKGDKREVQVPPLDEIKQKIWQTLFHSRRIYIQKYVDNKVEELSQQYNLVVYNDKIENFLKKLESSNSADLNFEEILKTNPNLVLAEYNGGKILLSNIFADRKKSPTNRSEFWQRFTTIKEQHIIAKFVSESNDTVDSELQNQIEIMKSSLLRSLLYQKEVKDKVEEAMKNAADLQNLEKVKYRAEKEKSLRSEFENYLKNKYKFKFIDSNFDESIKKASEQKNKQNLTK